MTLTALQEKESKTSLRVVNLRVDKSQPHFMLSHLHHLQVVILPVKYS